MIFFFPVETSKAFFIIVKCVHSFNVRTIIVVTLTLPPTSQGLQQQQHRHYPNYHNLWSLANFAPGRNSRGKQAV